MKFSKLRQLFLVSTIGLLVATLLTACQIVTIDFVYVASSAGSGSTSSGQIDIFAVDSQSGALRPGPASVSSGGVQPVAMAVSASFANIYVANQDKSVVHFALALHGEATQKDVITLSAAPVAIAVNQAGTYLYVVSGLTGGQLTEYALSSDGTIGAVTFQAALTLPSNPADVIIPTAVTVLANNAAVYVAAYDQAAYNPGGQTNPNAPNPGWVFGYSVATGGLLTPSANSPFKAGVKPSALAGDPTNRFLYVTDFASNQLIGFSIQSGYHLTFLLNGPFKTGNEPVAIAIDPRGKFIYVANSLDSSISAYAIDLSTGTPSIAVAATGGGTNNVTDTQPVAIVIDPALGRFVYTANYLGNSVSGFRLDPNAGSITANQATPYPTGAKPTAIVSVPHGNHALQSITP